MGLTATPPPCDGCKANCCTRQSGWVFVPLTTRERRNPLFAPLVKEHLPSGSLGFEYLPEGPCPFLDQGTRKCSIYEQRPSVCRRFDCRTCVTGKFYDANPEVWERIEAQVKENERASAT